MSSGKFIWEALPKCYERYLFMYLTTPDDKFSGPTPLIDLVWHVHMMDPVQYRTDMQKFVGTIPIHTAKQGESPERFQHTSAQWEKVFGVSFEEETEFWKLKEEETRPFKLRDGVAYTCAPKRGPVMVIPPPRNSALVDELDLDISFYKLKSM
jgi:hypothetical protein